MTQAEASLKGVDRPPAVKERTTQYPILLAFRQLCALAPPAAAVMVDDGIDRVGITERPSRISLWNYLSLPPSTRISQEDP